jgi:hypothetical protein
MVEQLVPNEAILHKNWASRPTVNVDSEHQALERDAHIEQTQARTSMD